MTARVLISYILAILLDLFYELAGKKRRNGKMWKNTTETVNVCARVRYCIQQRYGLLYEGDGHTCHIRRHDYPPGLHFNQSKALVPVCHCANPIKGGSLSACQESTGLQCGDIGAQLSSNTPNSPTIHSIWRRGREDFPIGETQHIFAF